MSQEINDPNIQDNPTRPSQPRNNTIIYWVVIGVLLITCIYLAVKKNQIAEKYAQTSTALTTSDSSRTAIQTDYDAALGRLDQLTSKNAQLDSVINDQNGDIAKLKRQIHSILSDSRASASQLAKAKQLIGTLNGKVKTYEERIAELEKENSSLTDQNAVISKERDTSVANNIALKQVGSVLHASNIRMKAIHVKRSGKATETEKARRADQLKITFDIDENRIAESGNKALYMKITDPDGKLLSNAAYGSGVTTTHDGQSFTYTVMKQIPLQQNEPVKDVSIEWHQDSDYKKGSYSIEIFNSGYKIGSSSVVLH